MTPIKIVSACPRFSSLLLLSFERSFTFLLLLLPFQRCLWDIAERPPIRHYPCCCCCIHPTNAGDGIIGLHFDISFSLSLSSNLTRLPCPSPIQGHKRKLGLIGAKRTTITVHRSEEILPRDVGMVRQGTSISSGEEQANSLVGFEADFGEGSERYPVSNRGCGGWPAQRSICYQSAVVVDFF